MMARGPVLPDLEAPLIITIETRSLTQTLREISQLLRGWDRTGHSRMCRK